MQRGRIDCLVEVDDEHLTRVGCCCAHQLCAHRFTLKHARRREPQEMTVAAVPGQLLRPESVPSQPTATSAAAFVQRHKPGVPAANAAHQQHQCPTARSRSQSVRDRPTCTAAPDGVTIADRGALFAARGCAGGCGVMGAAARGWGWAAPSYGAIAAAAQRRRVRPSRQRSLPPRGTVIDPRLSKAHR